MKMFRGFLVTLCMAAATLAPAVPAYAQDHTYTPTNTTPTGPAVLAYPRATYVPNEGFEGAYDMTAPTVVSSTTAVNLPGLSFTLPPVSAGDYTRRVLTLCYSADVTKATSTTGALQVAQDGVVWVTSPRYVTSAAGRSNLMGCFSFSRISPLATTVITVQAVSGDTAAFTVTNAQAYLVQRTFNNY